MNSEVFSRDLQKMQNRRSRAFAAMPKLWRGDQ
jgi:hypothetical protein